MLWNGILKLIKYPTNTQSFKLPIKCDLTQQVKACKLNGKKEFN